MQLPTLTLNKHELSDLNALQKEWLVTNGLGGYASSTVLGANTRKYHGLLVAALNPPGNRNVCLSKLDEDVIFGENILRLGSNEFQHGFFPEGHRFLTEFRLTPFPKYVYAAGNAKIEKTVFMPHWKNVTVALYRFLNKQNSDAKVRIFPLLTCRHFHNVIDKNAEPLGLQQKKMFRTVEVNCEKPKATIILSASNGNFIENPNWVQHLFYREEANRGESSFDDCFQPGYFEFSVAQGLNEFAIVASAYENAQECRETLESVGTDTRQLKNLLNLELGKETHHLSSFLGQKKESKVNNWINWILSAADSFVVRGNSTSVIAGYHWFESWGRDTFISLPGILLVTGRFAETEQVLLRFAKYLKHGLIPNFIPDKSGEPAYNTVDGTLWYVNAVLQYLKYTGDFRFVEENLWESLQDIMESHERGTAFGIHVENDGLLAHGPRLTWMDAEVDGTAVTPRAGKAVEVQALWYNALKTSELIAVRFGQERLALRWSQLSSKARQSFDNKFWNKEEKCLFDVLQQSNVDASLRPNQIIAAALDFPILYQGKAELVVNAVQHNLLTACGLRTLAQGDPGYRGIYEGDRASRDQAYHNGTVWPWMLGPFTTAFLKTKGKDVGSREYAFKNFVLPIISTQLVQAGLGTISEIFDGDPPHAPKGCISQAWSVAELLRIYVEDVLRVRPKYEKKVFASLGV